MEDCCKLGNGYGETVLTLGAVSVVHFHCDECDEVFRESIHTVYVAEDRLGWAGRVLGVWAAEGWEHVAR